MSDIQTLKAHIKSHNISSMYVFTGEEWKGQEVYLTHIAKVTGAEIKRVDSIGDVYSKLKNNGFVSKRYLYVARDDKNFMESDKLQSEIPSVLNDNIYVMLLTKVDKRTKFYNKYKNDIIEFEHFDDKVLIKYIQKEINLSPQNCKKLIDLCERDYGRILLEIDKIKNYMKMTKAEDMVNNSFEVLLFQGVIYTPPKDAIFDFVSAVLNRSTKCWDLLQQSYAVGEANMVLISVLYNNFKQVLQVQSCKSQDISKSTGLTGWQIKCAKEYVGNYNNRELVNAMKLIQQVQSDIVTGRIDDGISVQYILANVL